MSETNGTGIQYPTLELGGKLYTVKFTRGGILYRLSKNGVDPRALGDGIKSIAAIIDMLYAALHGQYLGTVEDLADLLFAENKMEAAGEAVNEAVKKAFPPTQTPAAGTAAIEAAPQQVN